MQNSLVVVIGEYFQSTMKTTKQSRVLELHGHLCLCGDRATQVHCKTIGSIETLTLSNLSALCQHCYDYYNRKRPYIKIWKYRYPKQRRRVSYNEYIHSDKWQDKRSEVFARDDTRCVCGNQATEVHHKTYTNLGNEPISDLIALCRHCHTTITKGKISPKWEKRGDNEWYRLDGLPKDIVSLRCKGVYIIWYFDRRGSARTVKVKSGQLRTCLAAENRNPQVQRYADRTLYVTWALVREDVMGDIASSLSQKLEPFAGETYSGDTWTIVELPWC